MQEDDFRRFNDFIEQMWNAILHQQNGKMQGIGFNITIDEEGKPKFEGAIEYHNEFENPPTEVIEYIDRYEVILDAPGIQDPENVDCSLTENGISIKASRNDFKYQIKIPIDKQVEFGPIRVTNRLVIITLLYV